MAGDPLKKVRPGERIEIPAEAWNLLIDAARAQRNTPGNGEGNPISFVREQTKIFVRNNSGSTVLRYGILALTGVVISPSDNLDQFKEQATFEGDAPTDSTPAGLWCVALEPIRDGEIGLAAIDGIVPVQLSVPGSLGAFAIVLDADTTTLGTSDTGDARILWAEASGSTRWGLIRLGDASVAEGGGGSGLTINYTGGTTVNIDNTSTISNSGNSVYPPSTISTWTGDQTDLDIGFATRFRVASDQHYRVLNSLVAVAGRVVCLHNVGSYVILIAHEHSGSTAANRIRSATGNYYWLAPGHEVTLWYDGTTSRWRVSESSDERLGGTATYALTADTADFALTRDATQHRITPDADGWTISGFTGGVAGLRHCIINGSDSDSFTLLHSDVGSSAANRLFLPNGEDVVIPPRAAFMIEWDDGDDRWHLHHLGQVEPTLADTRIGYGSATDKLTGTLDLVRESEAVLRIRGSTGTAQPIVRIQRNIEGVDLADGDIVGQRIFEPYYDAAYVECFEETIKHHETEATNKIAWEIKVGSGAADNSALKAGTDGKVIISQASTTSKILGTGGTHGEVVVASVGNLIKFSSSTLEKNFRGARAYESVTSNSYGSLAWNSIPLDAENFDTDSMHSNVTNNSRITIPTGMGGYWDFRGFYYPDTNGNAAGTVIQVRILLNGSTVIAQSIGHIDASGAVAVSPIFDIRSVSAGDYVELQIYHTGGSNMKGYANDILCFLLASFVGVTP